MRHSASIATGRETSLFARDIAASDEQIRKAVTGKHILAIGGAGSIGSSTVHVLARYGPAALHIVDQNENGLAELVRQLRSAPMPLQVDDFQTLPLDFGASAMERLLAAHAPYDRILNFAAIKHVRTEKDPFGILQMLDTNIVKQHRLRGWIARYCPGTDYFSVSTDKAANPVSFMGATKRVMEHVLFDGVRAAGLTGKVTTARFANVAFSNGSLLQSFENRFARGEPLAAPRGIRRYFVSLEEAGEICTLASIVTPHGHIAIPRLDPCACLVSLEDVAMDFLHAQGVEPVVFADEREACQRASELQAKGQWPLILTHADTAGEKPYEEFVGVGEHTREMGLNDMLAVGYSAIATGASLDHVVARLEAIILGTDERAIDKGRLKAMIGELEPGFLDSHIESARNLDQRA